MVVQVKIKVIFVKITWWSLLTIFRLRYSRFPIIYNNIEREKVVNIHNILLYVANNNYLTQYLLCKKVFHNFATKYFILFAFLIIFSCNQMLYIGMWLLADPQSPQIIINQLFFAVKPKILFRLYLLFCCLVCHICNYSWAIHQISSIINVKMSITDWH